MSNTRVVDQQRSALRHTRRWQTAARRRPRGLARLRREPVSDRPPCSAQAELEALCSNSSLMLDRRPSPPVPRCVSDPRTRISLLSDAQRRVLRGEPLEALDAARQIVNLCESADPKRISLLSDAQRRVLRGEPLARI